MGFLDKEKLKGAMNKEALMGALDKAKDVASDVAQKATVVAADAAQKANEIANDKLGSFKEDAALKSMTREEALNLYNEKNGEGTLKLILEAENIEGPAIDALSEIHIKTDNVLIKLQKGEKLELPMMEGEHTFEIKWSIIKAAVTYAFTQNTTIFIGVDMTSNTIKINLLDENGNKIEGSDDAVSLGGYTKFLKSASMSEASSAHSDADYSFLGTNGQIYAYEDRIIIEREGTSAKIAFPFAKPMEIPMSEIDSILISEPGPRGIGYVKVCTKSNSTIAGALKQVETDKYAVMALDSKAMRELKDYINPKIGH